MSFSRQLIWYYQPRVNQQERGIVIIQHDGNFRHLNSVREHFLGGFLQKVK